jgi:RHS repeat-associated protein/uncharacterized delta-60 repeat protein
MRFGPSSLRLRGDYEGLWENVRAGAVQDDGRILVAGSTTQTITYRQQLFVVRYMPNGVRDELFGDHGRASLVWDGGGPTDMALQSDGKILLAGVDYGNFTVARLNRDGTLDDGSRTDSTPGDSFGHNGFVTTWFSSISSDKLTAIAVDPEDRIVLAGESRNLLAQLSTFALQRWLPDGDLDSTFGISGKATAAVPSPAEGGGIEDIAFQSDGRIVAVGYATFPVSRTSSQRDFAVARFNIDGTLDDGGLTDSTVLDRFGTDGFYLEDVSARRPETVERADYASAVKALPDDSLIVGGTETAYEPRPTSGGWTQPTSTLLKLSADGDLDSTFRFETQLASCSGGNNRCSSSIEDIAIDEQGTIFAAGTAIAGYYGIRIGYYDKDGVALYTDYEPWSSVIPTDDYTRASPVVNPAFAGAHLHGPANNGNPSAVSDPVTVTTGNMYDQRQDMLVAARGLPIQFVRTYSSHLDYDGPLGYGWTHLYDSRIREHADSNVTVYEPGGARKVFYRRFDGSYRSPYGLRDRLIKDVSGDFSLVKANGVQWKYAASGQLTEIVDRNGNTLSFTYTGDDLTRVEAGSGQFVDIDVSGGRIVELTDQAGRTVEYSYDRAGDLVEVTDVRGQVSRYEYDDHNIVSHTSPPAGADPGETWTFEYDDQERVIETSADSGLQRRTFVYEPENLLTRVEDAKGRESVFHFDSNGNITRITDPYGRHIDTTWNGRGLKASQTDANGHKTDYRYDSLGRVSEVQQPAPSTGNPRPTTEYLYEGVFDDVREIVDPRGNSTFFEYDAAGNVIETENELGEKVVSTYTAYGELETEEQFDSSNATTGRRTRYEYDRAGNLETTVDAYGRTVESGYDLAGRPVWAQDELGRVTSFEYADDDQITRVTYPAPRVGDPQPYVQFTYDERGNLTRTRDENGNVSTTVYDRHNRVVSVEDPTGITTESDYDIEGLLVRKTEAVGTSGERTTEYVYDDVQRLVEVITEDGTVDGIVSRTVYDDAGRPVASVDPRGRTTGLGYDDTGRLVRVTLPDSTFAEYRYDAAGLLTETINPRGNSTTYEYDALGRMRSKSVPDTLSTFSTWSYQYDRSGNLAETEDAEGQVVRYGYDLLDRLVSVDADGTDADSSTVYDAAGRVSSSTDATGTTTYEYDDLDRVVAENLPGSKRLEFGYDPAGQRTSLVLPGGSSSPVTYTYDDAGRLTGVVRSSQTTSYVYDDAGRLSRLELPVAGAGTQYGYDAAGRLSTVINTGVSGALIDEKRYVFDKASNVLAIRDENDVATSSFDYDDLDRLIHEQHTGPGAVTYDYRYDEAGNRTERVTNGNTGSPDLYTYDAAERMITAGPASFTYDRNGNATTRTEGLDVTRYAWDPLGRLTGVDLGARAESYVYDSADRRVQETTATGTTDYVFDGMQVVQSTSGGVTLDYLRGLGEQIIAEQGSSGTAYQHHDALGSTVALTDSSGAPTDTYDYDAFGQVIDHNGASPNAFLFLGERYNPATKLHDFHARSYSAADGRFLGRDPITGELGRPYSQNPYQYGYSNPLTWQDPYGLFSITDPVKWVGGRLKDAGDAVIDRAPGAARQAFDTLVPGGTVIESTFFLLARPKRRYDAISLATYGLAAAAEVPTVLKRRATSLSIMLRQQRSSFAGRYLPKVGRAARSLIPFSRKLGLAGVAITVTTNYLRYDPQEATVRSGATVVGGLAGTAAGVFGCMGMTAASAGVGIVTCPVIIIGGGYLGADWGDRLAAKLYD